VILPVSDPPRSETRSYAELLALAVHEFRTPVTVVGGYLRMLVRNQDDPLTDRQRKLIEEAERSCSRLADLIAQMSDLANIESGHASMNRADVQVFDLLADAAAGITEGQDRGVELQLRGAVPGTVVEGDPVRLRAAFSSVLHAAAREKAGSTIVFADCGIRAESGQRWAHIRVGDEAALALVDGDPGAFDEYRGGIGMVLPIARRIIEAHGGRIWSPLQQKRAATAMALPIKT
jgi:signal transduction histidine kinase